MYFNMPVLVYEDDNCIKKHSDKLAQLGNHALIVTGRRSAKANGSLEDVIETLNTNNTTYIVFDEIEENPSIETIMKAQHLYCNENIDFVIGIGGGSPLDAAKAIALMLANPDKTEAYLDEPDIEAKCLPVVAIPTTCGTGSEVTGISVLTRHSKRTKGSIAHKIYPKFALIDCKYLKSAPMSIIRNTAIDALAHLIESYINSTATDYSRMFSREGLRIWSLSKDSLLLDSLKGSETKNLDIYKNLMSASTFAGMAIAHTGTGIPHALSYSLTYELGIPHGKACAYFLTGYLKEAPANLRAEVLELAGFADLNEFKTFLVNVCDLQPVSQTIISDAVKKLSENKAKLKSCPYQVDVEILERIGGV